MINWSVTGRKNMTDDISTILYDEAKMLRKKIYIQLYFSTQSHLEK